ncbi:DUF1810 domain-containing protein [Fulvimarina sp. 2208YS6-2-32]|uniref:DUF1810 domain-containing protein n=1 Tax=Fulvimarina uroteuthidis TaxID=3098149 RepID=A0ABU5I453_9HYPH|nr:DUF1810 domain-containing protein [Fulvimarina sp. 2208YS6-2-32]MDY8110137.1 DUF1810 domain-containing protein [Fulvimarina sp. 2208YS6-2-32]
MTDIDLERFITAQDGVLSQVDGELAAGRKRSHWMWFIFPQLAGLGHSSTAQRYAIADLEQARRYLDDPVLGNRLRQHVRLMLQHKTKTATAILGTPDDMKFRSSLTLFKAASSSPEDDRLFQEGLDEFYGGAPDPQTTRLLSDD